MTPSFTPAVRRAISNYTAERCREAYRLHSKDGEGACTVGIYLGLTTRQADAAINAGSTLANASTASSLTAFAHPSGAAA